jgi:hypothetical protein
MLGDDDEDEEDDKEDYDRDKYSNIKKQKEQVHAIGKSKDDVSVAEIERHWADRLDQMRDMCDKERGSHETTKRKMRIQLGSDGEEANLSENMANYCRMYLFPRFKFPKDKWDVFDPEQPKSLSNFVKNML